MNVENDDLLERLGTEEEPAMACVREGAIDHGRLSAYRAGTLAKDEVQTIDRHLIECAYCRDVLRELSEPMPAALINRLEQAIHPERVSPWRARLLAVGGLAAAVFLAVVFVVPELGKPIGEYSIVSVEGGVRTLRSGTIPETNTGTVFVPDTHIRIKLAPRDSVDGTDRAEVRLFVASRVGVLRAVKLSSPIQRGPEGELGIRTSGRELLGETPGFMTLFVVVTDGLDDADELDELAGQSAETLRARGGKVLALDVELRRE